MIEAAGRHLRRVETAEARPGDVLIFRLRPGAMAKHCAIMTHSSFGALGARVQAGQRGADAERARDASATRMIHAVEGSPVCEVHLSPWWRRRIAAVFRFPD
jgi:cell wall-associated NlpC family hydrolase